MHLSATYPSAHDAQRGRLVMTDYRPALAKSLPPPKTTDDIATCLATSYAGVMAFMTVVAEGSFARAGDRLEIGRSAVSRSVLKLETQLGVRLISRTTRGIALTGEGELFHASCQPGVERLSQALHGVRELREGPPSGILRICAPVGFGRAVVAPLLSGFRTAYPHIDLDLLLGDTPRDFVSDRVDVSFRDGRLEDSQIVAMQLCQMKSLLCASPAYVEAHGRPASIEEIGDHRCINFRSTAGRVNEWEFKVDGIEHKLSQQGAMNFNDSELVLQAVLDDQGIAQMPAYQVCGHLAEGRLVSLLDKAAPDDRRHYVCYLSRQHLPSRIRVFVDYMANAVRSSNQQCHQLPPRALAACE